MLDRLYFRPNIFLYRKVTSYLKSVSLLKLLIDALSLFRQNHAEYRAIAARQNGDITAM